MARLMSLSGLLALGLASVGLYGVTAFGVTQRRREIAVRLTLGADRARIVRALVSGPVGHGVVGLLMGGPLAVAASRALAAHLYGIGSDDPATFAQAAAVLLATAAVAALVPSFRAASIDPATALRIP